MCCLVSCVGVKVVWLVECVYACVLVGVTIITRLLSVVVWLVGLVGWLVLWLFWCWLDKIRELGIERTPTHALPKPKLPTSDTILTDLHTLTIHISVYLIPVFYIIYQDKKIG